MVGGIEAMIQHWKEEFHANSILNEYFAKDKNNYERIHSLINAFKGAGINVDDEVLKDYLAIKYLRNTIVHARWKKEEKVWVEQRGFPTDTRKLTEEHWHKILEVNENMMMYIALTSPELRKRIGETDVIKIRTKKEESLKPLIIRRENMPFLIYQNLANIASEFYGWIVKAATSDRYNWHKDLSDQQLNSLSHKDAKRLFYLAAKKASKEDFNGVSECRKLIRDIFFFWNLYKQETFDRNDVDIKKMQDSLTILERLHKMKSYPQNPYISLLCKQELPPKIKTEIVKCCLRNYEGLSETKIIDSLRIGKLTYDFLPDITPVLLFCVYLPIVIDENNVEELSNYKDFILTAMKLHIVWYFLVEKHESPDTSELLFYEELFNELIK